MRFEQIKVRFNRFRSILRESIKRAKQTYYNTTFHRFKHDIKPGLGSSTVDQVLKYTSDCSSLCACILICSKCIPSTSTGQVLI